MIPHLYRILQIIVVVATYMSVLAYVSAFFENIDVVNVFDYESDVFFEVLEPEELGYTYRVRPATNFGVPMNDSMQPFKSKLVPTEPYHCCSIPENRDHLEGHIALVERGSCTFKMKALYAEKAGAVGIIISDYDQESDLYIDMLDDESVKLTQIYAGFLLGKNGHMIKSTLNKLNRQFAEIHIPLNLTKIGVHNKKQPPWVVW